jgi:type II secretory pathway pseudopilin PulG
VPRLGPGGGGAVVTVALIGILAAVAIPAYENYTARARTAAAYQRGHAAAEKVGSYYMAHQELPAGLAQAGVADGPDKSADGLELDPDDGSVRVSTVALGKDGAGALVFAPALDENKRVVWHCKGEDLAPAVLPQACR